MSSPEPPVSAPWSRLAPRSEHTPPDDAPQATDRTLAFRGRLVPLLERSTRDLERDVHEADHETSRPIRAGRTHALTAPRHEQRLEGPKRVTVPSLPVHRTSPKISSALPPSKRSLTTCKRSTSRSARPSHASV
jgi:hypothetical protein